MEVYADYAATTPVKQQVIDKMMEIYTTHYGNPSSIHSIGRDARKYLDESRRFVAKQLNAKPSEVILLVAQQNLIIQRLKVLRMQTKIRVSIL